VFRNSRIVTSCQKCYACWPESSHNSNVRFGGQDCSDDTTGIPRHLKEAATKRTKVKCPPNHLSTTSMGITGIEDKLKRTKQSIFPEWHIFALGVASPILTPLLASYDIPVKSMLFFAPLLVPSNTGAGVEYNVEDLI
jgi:hypothetical protein